VILFRQYLFAGRFFSRFAFIHVRKRSDFIGQMKPRLYCFGNPKRRSGLIGSGGPHQDVIVGDALNFPVLIPQGEYLANAGFPYKFFVQLADSGMAFCMAQTEISPVRDDTSGHVKASKAPLRAATVLSILSMETRAFSSLIRASAYLPASMFKTRSKCARVSMQKGWLVFNVHRAVNIPGFRSGHGYDDLGLAHPGDIPLSWRFQYPVPVYRETSTPASRISLAWLGIQHAPDWTHSHGCPALPRRCRAEAMEGVIEPV
jgi:hypothetical protein